MLNRSIASLTVEVSLLFNEGDRYSPFFITASSAGSTINNKMHIKNMPSSSKPRQLENMLVTM